MNPPIWHIPDDTRYDGHQQLMSDETWHLPRGVYRPIREVADGEGVKVAVLDTGYYPHESLPKPLAERSFISGENVRDGNGHGTHCAGTILSRDEDIGLAPKADLIVGKVLSNRGSGSSAGIAAGVEWAIREGADIISMSLGGGSPYTPTISAIKDALDQGIVVCCAAGNSGFSGRGNTIGWPARSGEAICVAALKQGNIPANFSSGGEQMTIAAPGERILSCNNGNGYVFMSGTSMATPFVAGCYALILSYMRGKGKPSMTGIEAHEQFVKKNATDLLAPGHDPATGYGMYDMASVLQKIPVETLEYV